MIQQDEVPRSWLIPRRAKGAGMRLGGSVAAVWPASIEFSVKPLFSEARLATPSNPLICKKAIRISPG
jgi:hypothetical protein